MTLISAISNIGSIKNNNTNNHEKINSSISMSNNGINQSASLLDAKIMADLLGVLGICVKAKVL